MAKKNIVAENETSAFAAQKIFPDDEGLGYTPRLALHRVLYGHTQLTSITQQIPEQRGGLRRGYHKHLFDAGKHKCRQRVVHHGLVIHRQQLFADGPRHWIQSSAVSACKQYPAHHLVCLPYRSVSTRLRTPTQRQRRQERVQFVRSEVPPKQATSDPMSARRAKRRGPHRISLVPDLFLRTRQAKGDPGLWRLQVL